MEGARSVFSRYYQKMYSYSEINARYPLLPVILGTGLAFWTYYVFTVVKRPVLAGSSKFRAFLTAYCPIMQEKYWPTPWCFESRAMTIMRSLYKSSPRVPYKRELLHLSDGGQVALDWMDPDPAKFSDADTCPTVLILPGLVGSSQESYALHYVQQVQQFGYRSVVFNNRGNGGAELLTPRTYNATNCEDLSEVIAHIHKKYPSSPVAATGISLGGLILTNYLTKAGKSSGLVAGMTVSVAYDMFESCKALELPVNKVLFNRHLAVSLVDTFKRNVQQFKNHNFGFSKEKVYKSRTIREFDDSFTAKQFGYPSYKEYYEDACIHEKLHKVEVPLLCLNAADDPFSPGHAIPLENANQSKNVCIMMTTHGGHIGFLEGIHPRHTSYMDRVFAQYISAIFEHWEEANKGS